MADSAKPKKVLILGHSYVRRLGEFVHNSSMDVSPNFGIPLTRCRITYSGYGGATVHRLHGVLRKEVAQARPDVVLLQIGSNDVRSNDDDPKLLADSIIDFARRVNREFGIEHVIVSQLFLRNQSTCSQYNDIIGEMNTHLHDRLHGERYISFWRHHGFWNPEVRALLQHQDQVHFNELGNYRYYRSLKGAILKACKQ